MSKLTLTRSAAKRLIPNPSTYVRELRIDEALSIPAASVIEVVSASNGKAKIRVTSTRGTEMLVIDITSDERDGLKIAA